MFHLLMRIDSEADPDPKQAEVRRIIDSYKTPPPLPKRGDSIARNIEKYFNTDLIKKGEEDDEENMELIEERILDNSSPTQSVDTDDQFEVGVQVDLLIFTCYNRT